MKPARKLPGSNASSRKKVAPVCDLDPCTKIKQLRKRFGAGLAPEWDGECTLGELLRETRFESLTEYVKHHGRQPEKT